MPRKAIGQSGRGEAFDARVRADDRKPDKGLFQSVGARGKYERGGNRPWLDATEYEVFKIALRTQAEYSGGAATEETKQLFREAVAAGLFTSDRIPAGNYSGRIARTVIRAVREEVGKKSSSK